MAAAIIVGSVLGLAAYRWGGPATEPRTYVGWTSFGDAEPSAAEPVSSRRGPMPTAAEIRSSLQRRLDALAEAYVRGDRAAAEHAMWRNHAVRRPDGLELRREQLLDQWARDWQQYRNRRARYAVQQVRIDGHRVSATWWLELIADMVDESGSTHVVEFRGRQRARFVRVGGQEWLEYPIVFTDYERKLDGRPWPDSPGGRPEPGRPGHP